MNGILETMVMTKSTSQLFAMLDRAGVGAKLQARYVPNRNSVLHIEIIGSHETILCHRMQRSGCPEPRSKLKSTRRSSRPRKQALDQPLSSLTSCNDKSAGRPRRCSRSSRTSHSVVLANGFSNFLSKHPRARKIRVSYGTFATE